MTERRQISREEFERIVDEVCGFLASPDGVEPAPEFDYWHNIWFRTAKFVGWETPMLSPATDGPTVANVRQNLLDLLVEYELERIDTSIAAKAIAKARDSSDRK